MKPHRSSQANKELGSDASRGSILVVDDQNGERELLMRILRGESYDVCGAADVPQALRHLHDDIDLVVTDVCLGKISGLDLLQKWKRRRPTTRFILVTGFGEVADAVKAIQAGADHYLTKPIKSTELLLTVAKAIDSLRRQVNRAELDNPVAMTLGFERIVGTGEAMVNLCARVRRAAVVDSTVLLTGESGTGKELFAAAIHYNSPRRHGPFVTVNMAAVPETLVESELFGHIRGAFTGASESRVGKFAAAHGGTLFIDEIGDFANGSQAKLLRVLESRKITPVGGNTEQEVDVRVVAATSRNLEQMVSDGEFRADLYFRLDVVHLHLPPLRERRDGIPLMIEHFLRELCAAIGRAPPTIEPELFEFLVNHDWPGNVRQLKNCLESMVVLADDDVLKFQDLPSSASISARKSHIQIPPNTPLEEIERTAIESALAEHDGNRTYAARALKISLRTLQRKLKEWDNVIGTGSVDADSTNRRCPERAE